MKTLHPNRERLQSKTGDSKLRRIINGPAHPVLQMQHSIGNQAALRLINAAQFQPGQKVGEPGDKYEQEEEKYREQLRQLDILIGPRTRTRAITDWAIGFFEQNPPISTIAVAVTNKVDSALLALNNMRNLEALKTGFIFDLTNWAPGLDFRTMIDYRANFYINRSETPWLLTYRIPRALAVAMAAVEQMRGKCEEHAFLAIYLLTIGHMIQNMPYGQLKDDIFYTGIAEPGHAKVVLVKGAEFKAAMDASKRETGTIDPEWLCSHPELWGENAWVIDGWSGEAKKLTDELKPLSYLMSQSFRRNPSQRLPSQWDVTIDQLVSRISTVYGGT